MAYRPSKSPTRRPTSKSRAPTERPESGTRKRAKPVRWIGARVLLVDDDPIWSRALTRQLEELGCAVLHAECSKEVLDLASALEPDVAIVDLGLPDIDGLKLARAMYYMLPVPPPVFLCTASDIRRCEDGAPGVVRAFHKPIDPDALADALSQVLIEKRKAG